MPKTPLLTGFLISLVMFSFFIGVFGLYFSSMGTEYGVTYDNDTMDKFNKMEEMNTYAKEYRDEVSDTGADQNFIEKGVDVIGGIVSSGINTVKIIFNSVDLILGGDGMLDTAETEMNKAGLGQTVGYLKITIASVLLILIFVGILLPIILRRVHL